MDGATLAIILVLILIIAGAIFIVVRNYQAEEESPPPVEAPRSESQTSSTTTTTTADSSWMYPRGELDFLSEDARSKCMAAYSLHHLFSKYKGPVARVRRLKDSARENFYATLEGELKTKDGTKLKDWIGNSEPMLDTWFDQSGNKRDSAVEIYTSNPVMEKRTDQFNKTAWQIKFDGMNVMKLGAGSRSVPLQDYADFTVSLNAKWEDTKDRSWETALWIGQEGNDSSVRKSTIFIGNYGASGKYAFAYGGNVDAGKVQSSVAAPSSVAKEPPRNFSIVGKYDKNSKTTTIKGYVDGSGFNTNSSDVSYKGPPAENVRVNKDNLYLGGHTNMTGGEESKPIKGAVTDLLFFSAPLVSSDFITLGSFNTKSQS